MTTFDYAGLSKDANDLIKEFGMPVILRVHNPGTYVVSTGIVTGDGDIDTNCTAAFIPWDETYIEGSKYGWTDEFHRHGTSILQTDIRCLLSPLSTSGAVLTEPKLGDKIVQNSIVYDIVGIKPIKPAGIAVLYDIALRS